MDRNSLYELVHKYRAKGFKQTQIADLLSNQKYEFYRFNGG
jgi:hypothetical protein